MKKVTLFLLTVVALSFAAMPAFAGQPMSFDDRSADDENSRGGLSFDDRWMNAENERHTDGGDVVYRCATDERGPKVQIPQEQIDRWIQENRIVAGGVIPVYFHVIYLGSEGNVPESMLDNQITVMNRHFAGRDYNGNVVSGAANTGYTFVKAGTTTRTSNRRWFKMTPGSGAESQAKNALAISPGSALNIYTCKPGQNLLGWAVFPWTAQAGTNQDGVVIHYGSLPGGNLPPYNLGGSATHEVGHYLGLYHTFQGGCGSTCSTTGDLVCDTPGENTATSGCPNGKDTCASTGLDPIHNYMDYSTDICYTNFTPGQDTRMNSIVTQYRSWIGATRVANDEGGPGAISDEPDPIGQLKLAEFGEGKADNGDVVYRCATTAKKKHTPIPQEQVDRWIQENRIVAGGVIPVNFHVIHNGREGDVPLSWINAQIQVLNYNYSGRDYNGNVISGAANTGYTFTLASVTRTKNSKWFKMTPGTNFEIQAKNALVVNPGSSLNIYTCKPGQNLLGWAYFPQDAAGDNIDGVVIHYASLPGGPLAPYNLGGTASHEVGHYLGLYHTFQGGCDTGSCSATGDQVCDTPAEASPTSGCPGGKDTCPAAGLDPIHNYMDYSTDICYTNFTTGQDTKMNTVVTAYRSWIGATRVANGAGKVQFPVIIVIDDGISLRVKPNPFNPRTKVDFRLPKDGMVSLRVYDIHGRLAAALVDRTMTAGPHSVDFDAKGLASGIYQMVLRVEGEMAVVKRVTLLK